MPVVQGTPSFPFYMPGSAPVEYPLEDLIRQRAIELQRRGYQAGVAIDPGDPYLGKVLESGQLYYQHPKVPGYHFEQSWMEGDARPPAMLPGSLDQRIALELARRDADGAYGLMDPSQRAYDAIISEAQRRARMGQPMRRV